MRNTIRIGLSVLRWPLGLIAVIGLPAAGRGVLSLAGSLNIESWWPLWFSLAATLTLWFFWWKHARWGRFITTIEHEALHAMVAMMTLIPVREMKVREDGSGHVLFEPPGHWLLYLAPYFIPLLLLAEIALVQMMGLPKKIEWALYGLLLGISLAGHLRQLHPRQTDFRVAGRGFTIAFLPTAFLLGYGIALSFILGSGWGGPAQFLEDWTVQSWMDVNQAFETVSRWTQHLRG